MFSAHTSILVVLDGHQGGRDAQALAGRLAGPEMTMAVADLVGEDPHYARLHDLVDAQGVDLLVVGALHHRHLDLRSSDPTRAALRQMPCAVAVAPWGYASRPGEAMRTIGVGYVDDHRGRVVLDAARDLAWLLSAEVHAITVVPPSNWETPDSGMGWRAVAAARRLAEIPGVHGTAAEGGVQHALTALSDDVDLLVIGSHHQGGLRRVLVGDVTKDLARSARCPLVVVPHPPPAD